MSHKRTSRRKRDSGVAILTADSTFITSLPPKRTKVDEQHGDETHAHGHGDTSFGRDFDSSQDKSVRRSSRTPKPKILDDEYMESGLSSPKSQPEPFFSRLEQHDERKSSGQVHEHSNSPLPKAKEKAIRRSSRPAKPKLQDDEIMESNLRSPKGELTMRFQHEETNQASLADFLESPASPGAFNLSAKSIRKSARVPKPKKFDDDNIESNLSSPRSEPDLQISKVEMEPVGTASTSSVENAGTPRDKSVRRSSRPPKPKILDDEPSFQTPSETTVVMYGETSSEPETSKSSNTRRRKSKSDMDELERQDIRQTDKLTFTSPKTRRKSTVSKVPYVGFSTEQLETYEKGLGSINIIHEDFEGHRRETRKSYKNYLKELGGFPDSPGQLKTSNVGSNKSSRKAVDGAAGTKVPAGSDKIVKVKEREAIGGKIEKRTPHKGDHKSDKVQGKQSLFSPGKRKAKSTEVVKDNVKTAQTENNSLKSPQGLEISPETSPRRASSRTPVPKRTFSLLDESPFTGGIYFEEENIEQEMQIDFAAKTLSSTSIHVHVPSDQIVKSGEASSKEHMKQKSEAASFGAVTTNTTESLLGSSHKRKKKQKDNQRDSSHHQPIIAASGSEFSLSRYSSAQPTESEQKMLSSAHGLEQASGSVTEMPKIKPVKKNKEKKRQGKESENAPEDASMLSSTNLMTDAEQGQKRKGKKKEQKNEEPLKGQQPEKENGGNRNKVTEVKEKTKHKHSKTKKSDQAHSEVKEEEKHIILKLHLPHADSSSHSLHKKHKHKHSEEEGISKRKRRKMSEKGEKLNSGDSSEDKDIAKKISIKFKGLSSKHHDAEVPRESPGVDSSSDKEGGKLAKDIAVKKKKKTASQVAALPAPEGQEHVKLVIKKDSKGVSFSEKSPEKTPEKEAKGKASKAAKSTPETKPSGKQDSTSKKPKGDSTSKKPKGDSTSKKPKGGSTPTKKGDQGKETVKKRKMVTGYLLFCKQERSKIAEANPGLEFAQISTKVGEAWNNLPDRKKQVWRDKATAIKQKLGQPDGKKADVPGLPSTEPVDIAAHFKLLGESLSLIGTHLMAQEEMEVHGSLSVLLDSVLCAMCPLLFLTSQVPEMDGCPMNTQVQILDDIAYIMPGLG